MGVPVRGWGRYQVSTCGLGVGAVLWVNRQEMLTACVLCMCVSLARGALRDGSGPTAADRGLCTWWASLLGNCCHCHPCHHLQEVNPLTCLCPAPAPKSMKLSYPSLPGPTPRETQYYCAVNQVPCKSCLALPFLKQKPHPSFPSEGPICW